MQTKQKNTGGSPKFAIPYKVAEIALKYGPTVSKGILEMENKILELLGEVAAGRDGS
jgi:hypothetical protein